MSDNLISSDFVWPSLPYDEWKATYDTLHMWTQIVGKIRLTLSPPQNQWWHVPLFVTPRGLTTSPIPYPSPNPNYGARTFEIIFDFIDHNLAVHTSDGKTRYMGLHPRTVADFYRELMSILAVLGIQVKINTTPQEVADPISCDVDTVHTSYDEEYASRYWRIMVQSDSVLREFAGRFVGKCSPVHFWWGSFDLAVERFSGKRASVRPGAGLVERVAGSHEYSAVGFWPGNSKAPFPAYYAYTYPAPEGLESALIRPEGAYYSNTLGEFLFPYDEVRKSANPVEALREFMQSTYEAGAELAGWDRASLGL